MDDYRCTKCNALLSIKKDKYVCEYCRTTYDRKEFNATIDVDYVIPFKLSIKDARKAYKSHIKSSLLTPSCFQTSKNINKMEKIYIPAYIYTLDSTGVVDFECSKDNSWKSSGTKYKKTDIYNVTRGGDITIKDMVVLATSDVDNKLLDKILPFDYNSAIKFEPSYIDNCKIYIPNKNKDELLNDINSKSKEIFAKELKKDIKGYNHIKDIDSSINLYNPNIKYILLPIYLLELKYKNKKYNYIINGLTGDFHGNIVLNKKRLIFIWIVLFLLIFFSAYFVQVIL